MSDPSYLSLITLPSGTPYYIKDIEARQLIADLTGSVSGAVHYVGTTTTVLSDGATTKPIAVEGSSYTQKAGDVVDYGNMEYIWNAVSQVWREFGSTGSLKALAFKDSASGNFTPAGTVSQPSFTGTEGNVSVKGTPAGSVEITKGNGTANYTPEGSVSVTPTVTMSKTNVTPIDAVGTLPSLQFSVSGETLNITWDPGTLPTKGSAVSVATDVDSATATASFSGTPADLEATFTGSELTSSGTYTPSGTVSQPSFTGTQGPVTVS